MADQVCKRNSSCTCKDCAAFNSITAEDLVKAGNIFPDRFGSADSPAPASPQPASPALPAAAAAAASDSAPPASPPLPAQAAASAAVPELAEAAPVAVSSSPPLPAQAQRSQSPPIPALSSTSDAAPSETAPAEAAAAPVDPRDIVERIMDKKASIKARKQSYVELLEILKGSPESPARFLPALGRIAGETNAMVLEAGLPCLSQFMELTGATHAGEVTALVVPGVIEKAFPQNRQSTVGKATSFVMDVMEIGGQPDGVVACLLKGLKSKKAKVHPVCVQVLGDAVRDFGIPAIDASPVLGKLASLFSHSDMKVRSGASTLAVELYKYLGPVVGSKVKDLRDAQLKELTALFNDITPGTGKPARYLRKARPAGFVPGQEAAAGTAAAPASSAAAAATAAPATTSSGAGVGAGAGSVPAAAAPAPSIDPYKYAETVDLLQKMPKIQLAKQMKEPKWNVRAAALDAVLTAIGPIPKLAAGDYGELLATLKLALKDKHEKVGVKAKQVLGALVSGLRQSFPKYYAKQQTKALLAQFREKSKRVLPAVNDALDAIVLHVLSLEEVLEMLDTPLGSSVTEVRSRTLEFLARAVKQPENQLSDAAAAGLCGIASTAGLGDKAQGVRAAGEGLLVQLALRLGEEHKAIGRALKKANDDGHARAVKRITAAVAAGGEEPQAAPAGATPPSPRRVSKSPMKRKTKSFGKGSGRAKSSARRAGSNPSGSRRSISAGAGRPSTSSSSSSSAVSEQQQHAPAPETGHIPSPEEAVEALTPAFTAVEWKVLAGAGGVEWKARVAALQAWTEAITAHAAFDVALGEAVLVHLHACFKGFKEGNTTLLAAVLATAKAAIEHCSGSITRRASALVVPVLATKLADRKLAEVAQATLVEIAANIGPRYVLPGVLEATKKSRAPPLRCAVLDLVGTLASDFGAASLDLQATIEFAKSDRGLGGGGRVAPAAVKLLAALYSQLGPKLRKAVVPGLGDSVVATLDKAFEKAGYSQGASAAPKRALKAAAAAAAAASAASALAGAVVKADLEAFISEQLLSQMATAGGKDSWKQRSAALAEVEGVLKQHPAVEGNRSARELCAALGKRLADTNQNLKTKAAAVLTQLAQAIGPKVEKYFKGFIKPLLACLVDKRSTMRSAVTGCLTALVVHDGEVCQSVFTALLPAVSWSLGKFSKSREQLLAWTCEHADAAKSPGMSVLVKPLMDCLQDRSTGARRGAQMLIGITVAACGRSVVDRAVMDLKPAAARTVVPLIDLAVASYAPSSSSSAKAPAAATQARAAEAAEEADAAPSRTLRRRNTARPGTSSGKPALRRRATVAKVGNSSSSGTAAGSTAAAAASGRPATAGAAQGSGKKSDSSAAMPLLTLSTALTDAVAAKDKRARSWHRRKPMFEPPNDELVQGLKAALQSTASVELVAAMFSPKRAGLDKAFDLLVQAVQTLPDEVAAHLDLLLQWCVVRMHESHVQGTARVIALLDTLFVMLRASDYRLTDHEAGVFLPHLVEKSGNSKERFRVGFAKVMKAVCFVFPSSKLVPFLVAGLRSKNNRTRSVCVQQLHLVAKENGWTAIGKRGLRAVTPLVGERDHELRTDVLELLTTVWLQLEKDNESLFKHLGSAASDKIQGLVEEKLKFYKEEDSTSSEAALGATASAAAAPRVLTSPPSRATHSQIAFSSPPRHAGAPESSPSPASKLAAAFDMTYNPSAAAGAAVGGAVMGTPDGSSAGILPGDISQHINNLFTIEQEDITAAAAAAAAAAVGMDGAASGPLLAGASAAGLGAGTADISGGSFTLHLSEIQDGIEAHAAAEAESAAEEAKVLAAGGSPQQRAAVAGPVALRRGLSFDSESMPEFVAWVISGLQGMISMFNEFMRGRSAVLDQSLPEYVNGGRVMETLFATCTGQADTEDKLQLVQEHANQIIITLTSCLHAAFGKMYTVEDTAPCFEGKEVDEKYLKKICSTFMELFRVEGVARAVNSRAMCSLLSELTQRLMDPRLAHPTSRHEQIIMAINSLALRVSLKANREAMMSGLLRLLQRCVPPQAGTDPGLAHKQLPEKVMRLTVKLMMKVQKFEERAESRQRRAGEAGSAGPSRPWQHVECGPIVKELHTFFCHHPAPVAGGADDIPTSAAKAVLRELVKTRGGELRECLREVPAGSQVWQLYEQQMRRFHPEVAAAAAAAGSPAKAQAAGKAAATPPKAPVAATATTAVSGVVAPPPVPTREDVAIATSARGDSAIEVELAGIFGKLCDPNGVLVAGVESLYRFKCKHPEVDFMPRLAGTSEPFRRFILQNLDSMAQREKASSVQAAQSSVAAPHSRLAMLRQRYLHKSGKPRASAALADSSSTASPPRRSSAGATSGSVRLHTGTAQSSKASPPGGNEGEALTDSTNNASSKLEALRSRMKGLKQPSTASSRAAGKSSLPTRARSSGEGSGLKSLKERLAELRGKQQAM